MAEQYSRPASGFRFKNGGMKTNCAPDAMAPDKYQLLLNARSYSDDEIRCRPGMQELFTTSTGAPIRNVTSYSQGPGTIRYLATSNGTVFLDNGTGIDAGAFDNAEIQAMVPYRPNQSVAPWVYIGDRNAYKKYSFPAPITNAVTIAKAGIAEPQTPVDAGLTAGAFVGIGYPTTVPSSAAFGTGGALSTGSRVSSSIAHAFTDPANPAIQYLHTANFSYQRNEILSINSGTFREVLDVYQLQTTVLQIQGIYYYSGGTGTCVVVPGNVGTGPGNEDVSVYSDAAVASLRRGSPILIGSEYTFVLSVTTGPNGQISFETTTASNHTATDTITILPGIMVYTGPFTAGMTIAGADYIQAVTTGVGGFNITGLSGSSVVFSLFQFQDQDYLHFSVNVDNLANLTEMKVLLDVGDGSFTQNFYFFAVRPSDIQAGIQNTLTQLGVAQLYAQRETIEEETQATHAASSIQTPPGSSQWAEIFVPLSELVRVGNDQSSTLSNLNAIQFLFNCTGTINIALNSFSFRGGSQLDVGDTGGPYRYRIRPRASMTGALGNPSPDMRYGVSPRRDQVTVFISGSAYDPQFDFWDIFRLGGVLTAWTFVGTCPVGTTNFLDIYDDTTIQNSKQLDFDNLEPWPSIDNPFSGAGNVTGTVAVVTGASTHTLNYLPGNKVTIGQNVYTLWTRPTNGPGGTFIFQFQENAGVGTAVAIRIYEPAFANNHLPYVWGPSDEGGVVFGAGDLLRSGTVSFSKNFAPDSVPDSYNVELCPPSEPIIGGVCAAGLSFAFSSNRVFPLRPSFGGVNQWTPMPAFGPGLASSFGIATDGRLVWYVATDGIRELTSGASVNLTHDDLSNMFPLDGVSFGGTSFPTIAVFQAPDYTQANLFRLAYVSGYLYFDYLDFSDNWNTLVYDVARKAWSIDLTTPRTLFHMNVIQPQTSTSGGSVTPDLPIKGLLADASGVVYEQVGGESDNGTSITFRVITSEFTGGEERAPKQWGDAFISMQPGSIAATIKPVSKGVDQAQSLSLAGPNRVDGIVSAGNTNLFSLGLDITATYNPTGFGSHPIPTVYIWQPSYLPQPVIEIARFTDWDDAGIPGNKFWQGFIMEATTSGSNKSLLVRDADTNGSHPFTLSPVNFPQQSEQAFSFNAPFVAHSVRVEPQDLVPWSLWKIRWVAVPYPESCEVWQTEGMTHGLLGFQHCYIFNLAYASTQPITVTLGTDQGPVPVLTYPSTGARISPVKQIIKCPFNKFKVVSYGLTSTAPFFIWKDLCEVHVKAWGSTGPYTIVNPFGGNSGMEAKV